MKVRRGGSSKRWKDKVSKGCVLFDERKGEEERERGGDGEFRV